MDKKAIIAKIREIRKKKGLTQIELAEKLGVSNSYIQKIEAGVTNVSMDRLQDVLHALEYEFSDLIDDSAKKKELTEWVKKAEEALANIRRIMGIYEE